MFIYYRYYNHKKQRGKGMKRFLILTSVLALTACAGSGGGSAPATGGATAGTPAPDRPNITEDSFPAKQESVTATLHL